MINSGLITKSLLVQAGMRSGKTITTFAQIYDLLLKRLGLNTCERKDFIDALLSEFYPKEKT